MSSRWIRRRLVLDGSGLVAYRSAGIGSLDFRRVYASFSAWPTASIEPVHATRRFGARHVVGFALVLSDGRSTLRADGFSEVEEAEAAAASSVTARHDRVQANSVLISDAVPATTRRRDGMLSDSRPTRRSG